MNLTQTAVLDLSRATAPQATEGLTDQQVRDLKRAAIKETATLLRPAATSVLFEAIAENVSETLRWPQTRREEVSGPLAWQAIQHDKRGNPVNYAFLEACVYALTPDTRQNVLVLLEKCIAALTAGPTFKTRYEATQALYSRIAHLWAR